MPEEAMNARRHWYDVFMVEVNSWKEKRKRKM